jgi:hypothetical protein
MVRLDVREHPGILALEIFPQKADPKTAPTATWVVLTGSPSWLARNTVRVAAIAMQ